jgi:hypothetical protein
VLGVELSGPILSEQSRTERKVQYMYGPGVSEMWISGRKGQIGGHVKECWSEVCLSLAKGTSGVCVLGEGLGTGNGVQKGRIIYKGVTLESRKFLSLELK